MFGHRSKRGPTRGSARNCACVLFHHRRGWWDVNSSWAHRPLALLWLKHNCSTGTNCFVRTNYYIEIKKVLSKQKLKFVQLNPILPLKWKIYCIGKCNLLFTHMWINYLNLHGLIHNSFYNELPSINQTQIQVVSTMHVCTRARTWKIHSAPWLSNLLVHLHGLVTLHLIMQVYTLWDANYMESSIVTNNWRERAYMSLYVYVCGGNIDPALIPPPSWTGATELLNHTWVWY